MLPEVKTAERQARTPTPGPKATKAPQVAEAQGRPLSLPALESSPFLCGWAEDVEFRLGTWVFPWQIIRSLPADSKCLRLPWFGSGTSCPGHQAWRAEGSCADHILGLRSLLVEVLKK